MPLLQSTARRSLLYSSPPVFLPQAGPFSDGGKINVSSLPNTTISVNSVIPTSRRLTMLKYNRFTLNASRTWTTDPDSVDMCVFLWANTVTINGTIDVSGQGGESAFINDGGNGGYGAAGGGGGGGGLQCTCCSNVLVPGYGGEGNLEGTDGDSGTNSTICCNDYGFGGAGGIGVGYNNWGNDGYNYPAELDLNPEYLDQVNQPYGFGGNGDDGDHSGGGGGGGGAGGLIIIVCNSITAGAGGLLKSRGGDPGVSASSIVNARGGDGGCIGILTRHYNGSLNAKTNVLAGYQGQVDGGAVIFQIMPDNTLVNRLFTDVF